MARSLFGFSGASWAAIEQHLSKNQPGAWRVDDRRVIAGIVYMLKCGGTAQANTHRRRQSIIAGTGGGIAASGSASWRL